MPVFNNGNAVVISDVAYRVDAGGHLWSAPMEFSGTGTAGMPASTSYEPVDFSLAYHQMARIQRALQSLARPTA